MAAPNKKRRGLEKLDSNNDDLDDMQNGSDSMDGSSDSEDEIMETEINVDFEARPLESQDLPGVKVLVRQLILDDEIVNDLPEMLLQQSTIGCVIKQCENPEESEDDDSDDVFGLISVINITEKKDVPCIKLLRSMLIKKCRESSDKKTQDILSQLLNDSNNHVGFVMCERFINIPPKISYPMYDSLRNDISAANSKQMPYKFSHYITISKLYEIASGMRQPSSDNYVNQEDTEFKTESLINFKYSVKDKISPALMGDWDASEEQEMMPFRHVAVLTADKWSKVIDKLKILYRTQ